jgi:hypothetical protein
MCFKILDFFLIKQILAFALLSYLDVSLALSQIAHFKYGEVSKEDLLIKSQPIDTSAAAIILFDVGEAVVERTSTIGTTINHHLRIKLFKKGSFEDWGTMKFFVQKGGMYKLKGATYNLINDKIIVDELPEISIFKRKYNKYSEEISVAFSNLREGCIVELSYTEKAENAYLPNWTFQHTIPIIYSEYSLSSPIADFTSHINGSIPITEHESKYDGKFQKWVMRNLPAFKPEPLMQDKSIYLSSVQFVTSYKSWVEIAQKYSTSAESAGILEFHGYLKKKAKELTEGMINPKAKIKAISDYIKGEVNWNGVDDIYAEEPKTILLKKEGTTADINLMFGSMLKKAGLDVNLVLLSTRDNGVIKEELPTFSNFNYVICEVAIDSVTTVFVDATDRYLPFDVLPEKCLNHKGFLIARGKFGWRKIEPIQRDKIGVNADVNISHKGLFQGKVRVNIAEYAAYHTKKTLKESTEPELIKEYFKSPNWNTRDLKITSSDVVTEPIILDYNFESDELGTTSNNIIYLNPFLFLKEEANPFKSDDRIYPIDLAKLSDKTLVCTITIPENYLVEELPQSTVIALPSNSAKCYFNINQTGNRILVTSRLQINKTLFQPEEYQDLKEFYARIVAKKNETIVLKRKIN